MNIEQVVEGITPVDHIGKARIMTRYRLRRESRMDVSALTVLMKAGTFRTQYVEGRMYFVRQCPVKIERGVVISEKPGDCLIGLGKWILIRQVGGL